MIALWYITVCAKEQDTKSPLVSCAYIVLAKIKKI